MRPMVATLLLAALLGVPDAIGAEEPLPPGVQIRITKNTKRGEEPVPGSLAGFYAASQPFTGRLVSSDGKELSVALGDGRVIRAPRELIGRLQVHDGMTNSALPAAITGIVGGAVLGAAAAGICVLGECRTTNSERMKGAAIGAGICGSLGALVGLAIKRDRWREVPPTHRLTLAPASRGTGVQVTLSW